MLTGIAIIVAALLTATLIIIHTHNRDSAEIIAMSSEIDDHRRQAAILRTKRDHLTLRRRRHF